MTNIENRISAREQTTTRARILFEDGERSLYCLVKDLSVSGARLATDGFYDCPDEVDLKFLEGSQRFSAAKSCRVVWRNREIMGVHFHPS